MKFKYIKEIDTVIIDGFYSKDQLADIKTEINNLNKPYIMKRAGIDIGSSTEKTTNKLGTSKLGVFLENHYRSNLMEKCSLVKCTRNNIISQPVLTKLFKINPFFKIIYSDHIKASHLLSYYEDGDFYREHTDASVFTLFAYFNTDKYTGGDLIVHSFDKKTKINIESKNGRVVIFPGCSVHEVTDVKGKGRYCYSLFFNINN